MHLFQILGVGASRTITLGAPSYYKALFSPPPPPPSPSASAQTSPPLSKPTPSPDLFTDEITAMLVTTHSQKMSLVELTKGYNQAFRSQGPKVEGAGLIQAIQKLSHFKVSSPLMSMIIIMVLATYTTGEFLKSLHLKKRKVIVLHS